MAERATRHRFFLGKGAQRSPVQEGRQKTRTQEELEVTHTYIATADTTQEEFEVALTYTATADTKHSPPLRDIYLNPHSKDRFTSISLT